MSENEQEQTLIDEWMKIIKIIVAFDKKYQQRMIRALVVFFDVDI